MLKAIAACVLVFVATGLQSQAVPAVKEYPNPTSVVDLANAKPTFDLGQGGDIEFHRIKSIVARSDGAFVVANSGSNSLYFFSAVGKPLRTVGRKGGGPGEYEEIWSAARLSHDTLAVLDRRNRRVTVLDPDGKTVRTFNVVPPVDSFGPSHTIVGSPSGSIFLSFSEISKMVPRPEAMYFRQRIFEYTSTGTRTAAAPFSLPMTEHFVQSVPKSQGGTAYWELAFGRKMTVRGSRTGTFTGDGTTWSIDERAPDGHIVATHRMKRDVEPVTEQRRRKYAAESMVGTKGAEIAVVELLIKEMPYPKTLPAYSTFEVDDAGQLWIKSYGDSNEPRAIWVRLDPKTSSSISVRMPERFRAMSFSSTRVLGVWTDEDDVEHVRAYALNSLK